MLDLNDYISLSKKKEKKTTFPCSNGIDLHIMISKSNNWSTYSHVLVREVEFQLNSII